MVIPPMLIGISDLERRFYDFYVAFLNGAFILNKDSHYVYVVDLFSLLFGLFGEMIRFEKY